ncbi:hypothetical protein H310_12632 [Aphanomyces invadans]|uniref:Uncharacterized protein n=1 Tax=Aphanomyces invadans TaxID=157072 RepID=A0A024TH98_9STRA|nr:hypothetical protein H310_12632 [Aphanomyces invadans]ETV93369.1 hypothetical protein H310_12632 [Aphanomyces invadans]|eukprot:XP_008878005.1 hypothetical protein H310_12632 [Aphanomyces invadans]
MYAADGGIHTSWDIHDGRAALTSSFYFTDGSSLSTPSPRHEREPPRLHEFPPSLRRRHRRCADDADWLHGHGAAPSGLLTSTRHVDVVVSSACFRRRHTPI